MNRRPTCSHGEFTVAYTCLQKIGNAEHKSKSRNLRDNRGEMMLPLPWAFKTPVPGAHFCLVTTVLRPGIQPPVFDKKGTRHGGQPPILKVATKLGSFQHSWTRAKMAEFFVLRLVFFLISCICVFIFGSTGSLSLHVDFFSSCEWGLLTARGCLVAEPGLQGMQASGVWAPRLYLSGSGVVAHWA